MPLIFFFDMETLKMFLSMAILKNPKLLVGHFVHRASKIPSWIKTNICLATKFIIDTEFFKQFSSNDPSPEGCIARAKICEGIESKHMQFYYQYCRMPFKHMLFENPFLSLLVEEIGEHSFKFIALHGNVLIPPHYCIVTIHDESGNFSIETKETYVCSNKFLPVGGERFNYVDYLKDENRYFVLYLLELLLFLNTRNTVVQEYFPTKRELKRILPVNVDKYVYRVIDIYRDKPVYKSLKEIEEGTVVSNEVSQQRRAHMVKGHFKKKKSGLFWWSSFLRCRNNANTKGIVKADYHTHHDHDVHF